MSRLRVLLVGRHLWPHGSYDSGSHLFQLATGLHRRGAHVELMTPRYTPSWPDMMTLREMLVHRPIAAPRSEWSMGRYVRYVTSWLLDHASSFDVLFADSMREESTALIEAGRKLGVPSVVRHAGLGHCSDIAWWQTSRAAGKCRKYGKAADRVVVASARVQRELLAQDFDGSKLVRIENGFPAGSPRRIAERLMARKALAEANSDLTTTAETPVVLCIGRMSRAAGMNVLAAAVPLLVSKLPDLRVWFIGDGPHREALYARMRGDGVRASIAMPGSFAHIDDLLKAADLYVQLDHEGLESFVPAAVSSELPIVMHDDVWSRLAVAAPEFQGGAADAPPAAEHAVTWVDPLKEKPLRVAILRSLERLSERRAEAATLRKQLLRTRPLSVMLDGYVRLFESLAARPVAFPPRKSSEATP